MSDASDVLFKCIFTLENSNCCLFYPHLTVKDTPPTAPYPPAEIQSLKVACEF